MIGVASPFILGAAVLAALVTCVLHFLSVRRPPVLLLPTMRFLPERAVRAVSRSARPSDLLLLLLRVSALLLAGVALAGVTWRGTGVRHGRVVVVSQPANAQGLATTRAQVAAVLRGTAASDTVTSVVLLDSVAHVLSAAESQSLNADTLWSVLGASAASTPTDAAQPIPTTAAATTSAAAVRRRAGTASLSAGIMAGIRSAGVLVRDQRNVDSVALVVVAPLTASRIDAALPAVRAMWGGTIRLVDSRLGVGAVIDPAPDSSESKRSVVFAGQKPNDAVASAFAARKWFDASGAGASGANAPALNATASTTPASNASATANSATEKPIPVEWPASGVPEGWTTEKPDTVGAVVARGEALVWPFVRTAHVPAAIANQGRAVAWWSDGAVAAIEIPTAGGCTRHVGIEVPNSSDLLQGRNARALLLALSAPCGGDVSTESITTETRALLQGTGAAASATNFRSVSAVRTPFAPVLLLLALALLLFEWWMRDREEAVSTTAEAVVMRRVA